MALFGIAGHYIVKNTSKLDKTTSFIGGSASEEWSSLVLDELLICERCQHHRVFLGQIYSPLHGSGLHRAILFYVCISSGCAHLNSSWKVFRVQTADKTQESEPEDETVSEVGACSWGVDTTNWGAENVTVENVLNVEDLPETTTDHVDVASCEASEGSSADSTENIQILDMEKLDDELQKIGEAQELERCVTAEKVNSQREGTIRSSGKLQAFYVDVFDPSTEKVAEKDVHELQLLEKYSREIGLSWQEFVDTLKCSSSGFAAKSGEQHEKAQTVHGDQLFYKFLKTLNNCPQQILRYDWKGEPVCPSNFESPVLFCQQCDARCEFELQLMPALLPSLIAVNGHALLIEFCTLLVYSCSASCDRSQCVEEHVVMLSEQDQHIFARFEQ